MSWIAKAALAAALLNCGLHSAHASDAQNGQWLKDGTCNLYNADARPGDQVAWTGDCADGFAQGMGTATFTGADGKTQSFTGIFVHGAVSDGHVVSRWGAGWSYDGEAVDGIFNGAGILTTASADRFEGQWTDGKMNGFGILRRANGDRYAGDWKNDKPNGPGELRHADGSLITGQFVDGKLAQSGAAPATQPKLLKAANVTPTGNDATAPFSTVSGKTLVGVDGSSIALNLIEGGMELQVVPADGNARKTTFTFMTDRMGTVVEDTGAPSAGSSVTGFFRLSAKGVEVRYADGRSTLLSSNGDGGILMTSDGDLGPPSCRNWYPAGHSFSDADKKAALNAYASRLGLAVSAGDGDGCSAKAAPAALAPAPETRAPQAAAAKKTARAEIRTMVKAKAPARMAQAAYHIGDFKGLETIAVKDSQVHAIDAMPGTVAVAKAAAPPVGAAAEPGKNEASQCLKVDSDGSHWGFRNSCDYAVQFAYCMAGSNDTLTGCGNGAVTTTVTGSVAANGFGALTSDDSLKEKDVNHNFRWIACGGGAGEVVAHLDRFEPPAGRCERTRTASN
jgi:hypothetical protein